MELEHLYSANMDVIKTVLIKDDLGYNDTAEWKYHKSLQQIFHSKKILGKIAQTLPRSKKPKTEHIIDMTKRDLLINLLNLLSNRLEAAMIDDEDINIETLLQLQEFLTKLKENE